MFGVEPTIAHPNGYLETTLNTHVRGRGLQEYSVQKVIDPVKCPRTEAQAVSGNPQWRASWARQLHIPRPRPRSGTRNDCQLNERSGVELNSPARKTIQESHLALRKQTPRCQRACNISAFVLQLSRSCNAVHVILLAHNCLFTFHR